MYVARFVWIISDKKKESSRTTEKRALRSRRENKYVAMCLIIAIIETIS